MVPGSVSTRVIVEHSFLSARGVRAARERALMRRPGHRQTYLLLEELEQRDCPSGGSSWPMYNFDASGSRVNPNETTLSPRSIGQNGLHPRWLFLTPGSVSGTPAIVNGVVYDGDLDGNFFAIQDTANGPVLRWQRNVGAPITDSPLVLSLPNGRSEVIFGDQAGYIYGFDTQTGALNWRIQPNTTSAYMAIYGSATSIQVGSQTYVTIAIASNEEDIPLSPTHPRFTSRGSVVLLDPSGGSVIWQTYTISASEEAAGSSGAAIWSSPTYDSQTGTIYVTTGNNYSAPATPTSDAFIALNAATGQVEWVTQTTPGDVSHGPPGPPPSGPDLDFGDSPQVYTLSNGTGVVGAGQKSGVYYVLNAGTGQVAGGMQVEPSGDLGGLFADSAVDQHAGLVLANGIDWPHPESSLPTKGDLFALSLDGNQQLWDFQTPLSPNITGVAVANGVVYFQSLFNGSLFALDEHTGALLSQVLTAGSSSGPAVANGKLYEGFGFAFGANFIGQNVSGGIEAVGLHSGGTVVQLEVLQAELQNLEAIAAFFLAEFGNGSQKSISLPSGISLDSSQTNVSSLRFEKNAEFASGRAGGTSSRAANSPLMYMRPDLDDITELYDLVFANTLGKSFN
jgi:polyvinyl alcohol dehydrogenase (cytochrome)